MINKPPTPAPVLKFPIPLLTLLIRKEVGVMSSHDERKSIPNQFSKISFIYLIKNNIHILTVCVF